MICSNCGENKPPYNFTSFTKLSTDDRFFFIHARRDAGGRLRNDICWTCNGGYRCLGCGHVKPASEFRVQGRYCMICKSTWRTPRNATLKRINTNAAQPTEDTLHGGTI